MSVKQLFELEKEKRLVRINIVGKFNRDTDSAEVESEVDGDNVCLQDCIFALARGVNQIANKISERTNMPECTIRRMIIKFIEAEYEDE